MRRLIKLLSLFAVLAIGGLARADDMILMEVGGEATAYVGPGDLIPGASAWWGLRCYSKAYTGNVADVWDAATGSTTETVLTCVNGAINQTIHQLSTTCASACRIKTLYDQSGSTNCSGPCDATQATNSLRPTLTLNCQNGHPCATLTGTQFLQSPNVVSLNAPYSASAVAETTNSSSPNVILGGTGISFQVSFANGAAGNGGPNTGYFYANGASVNEVALDNAPHAFNVSADSSGFSVVNIDGSENNGQSGHVTLSGNPFTLGFGPTIYYLIGELTEAGVWPFTSTRANRYALCASQNTYWGLGLGSKCSTVPALINDFQSGNSFTPLDEISHRDTNGNAIDARAGSILQSGSTYYLYGEAHACGSNPGTAGSPWCGVKVYTSTDLRIWTYQGLIFDPNGGSWQTNCGGQNGNIVNCYGPQVIYNAANNNYVVWIYGETGTPSTSSNFYILTCTTPTGGATPSTPGTGCTQQSNATFPTAGVEAPSLFQDGSGNGYAAYSDIAASEAIKVVALNSAFTNTTGAATSTGQLGEGLATFLRGGLTYIVYGSSNCAYCSNATLNIISASSPLGTYGSSQQLNGNSCNGQMSGIAINVNGTEFIAIDQWWSQANVSNHSNQGFSNLYWQSLIFSNTTPLLFSCQPSIDGPLPSSAITSPGGATDQTDYAEAFVDFCDISNAVSRMQQFTPTHSTVVSVALPLGKNNSSCSVGSSCAQPNGGVTVSLVTLDGSGNPLATLGSQTIPVANLQWATQWTTVTLNQTVSPGTTYGIELTSNTTVGCIGTAFSNAVVSAPYSGGVEKANSGSGWTTEANRSLLFSTY